MDNNILCKIRKELVRAEKQIEACLPAGKDNTGR